MQRGQFVWLMQRNQREQREQQVTATMVAAAAEKEGITVQTNLEDESSFLLRPENSLRVIVGPGVLRTKSGAFFFSFFFVFLLFLVFLFPH